ncbi:MAG: response regulator transcription factor [Lachnospiraceae bacterium]|nr:response regulator transcription factor [Lachnospiraceae bacterium]
MKTTRKIHVLIADDDETAREAARALVSFFVAPEGIYMAKNALDLMKILADISIDLAFLDMEMPDIDGFSVAEYLKRVQPKAQFVFLTGHAELGAKSYEYEPLDFLCKPVNALRMQKTFDRFDRTQTREEDTNRIGVETASGFELIAPQEIRFISRDNRKAVIHCGRNTYTTASTLSDLELLFSDYDLIRCHQSFLVSLRHVVSVQKSDFGRSFFAVVDTGEQVSVSRDHIALLKSSLEERGIRFI